MGYTRGHFSALVAMEVDMDENIGAGANIQSDNSDVQMVYLPLTDSEGKLLPVHFLTASEVIIFVRMCIGYCRRNHILSINYIQLYTPDIAF